MPRSPRFFRLNQQVPQQSDPPFGILSNSLPYSVPSDRDLLFQAANGNRAGRVPDSVVRKNQCPFATLIRGACQTVRLRCISAHSTCGYFRLLRARASIVSFIDSRCSRMWRRIIGAIKAYPNSCPIHDHRRPNVLS